MLCLLDGHFHGRIVPVDDHVLALVVGVDAEDHLLVVAQIAQERRDVVLGRRVAEPGGRDLGVLACDLLAGTLVDQVVFVHRHALRLRVLAVDGPCAAPAGHRILVELVLCSRRRRDDAECRERHPDTNRFHYSSL
jgi:hypothetical protein